MKCLICSKDFANSKLFSYHLKYDEKINTKLYYDKFFKKDNEGKCIICGKETTFSRITTGYKKYCSKECKDIWYAREHNAYRNREQAIQTCKEKFNGKMNGGAWNTRRKHIEEFEKEHNCTSTKKLVQQYGQGWLKLDIPRLMLNKQNSFISNDYIPIIQEYISKKHVNLKSGPENYILDRLVYDGMITSNNRRVISPKELDIYIPDLKLAIEYNGTYWHAFEHEHNKFNHREKSLLCREQGIRLIHIFEFENLDDQIYKVNQLILGNDLFEPTFTKNNLLYVPTDDPIIIYKDEKHTIYSA